MGIQLSDDGKSCTLTFQRTHKINGNIISRDRGSNKGKTLAADNVDFCYKITLNLEGDKPEIADVGLSQRIIGSIEKHN
jgi:hypothetical protein